MAFLLGLVAAGSVAHAQGTIRSPSLNLGPRVPTMAPSVAPRVDPNIAGRVVTVRPTLPTLRNSSSLYQGCGPADRDGNGQCVDRSATTAAGGGGAGNAAKGGGGPARPNATQAALNSRAIANELVAEIDGALSEPQADALARRHGLARISSQAFPLLGATIGLFRIADRRSPGTASREFAADPGVRSVQPNFRYVLQEQMAVGEGDPAQYALAKLRLPEAHAIARGDNVTIAVIDSGIDVSHPELANSIADSFDALGTQAGPHAHGTGIAGAIAAHARLMGSAPAVRILAIRAFGATSGGAESNSYVILRSIDYAALHGAQIINMSFAGPKDAVIARALAATAERQIVMVAAAGNGGAKSPPLYPAADPHVIAVSATDAQDRLLPASNRGGYVAIAAPGADIFLPAPDQKYQVVSGTSFSAAYVSGIAALVLERNPALRPDGLRAILVATARDLGSPGRDDQFGAGEANAYAAVKAAETVSSAPSAASPNPSSAQGAETRAEAAPKRTSSPPVAAVAADKADSRDSDRPVAK